MGWTQRTQKGTWSCLSEPWKILERQVICGQVCVMNESYSSGVGFMGNMADHGSELDECASNWGSTAREGTSQIFGSCCNRTQLSNEVRVWDRKVRRLYLGVWEKAVHNVTKRKIGRVAQNRMDSGKEVPHVNAYWCLIKGWYLSHITK